MAATLNLLVCLSLAPCTYQLFYLPMGMSCQCSMYISSFFRTLPQCDFISSCYNHTYVHISSCIIYRINIDPPLRMYQHIFNPFSLPISICPLFLLLPMQVQIYEYFDISLFASSLGIEYFHFCYLHLRTMPKSEFFFCSIRLSKYFPAAIVLLQIILFLCLLTLGNEHLLQVLVLLLVFLTLLQALFNKFTALAKCLLKIGNDWI